MIPVIDRNGVDVLMPHAAGHGAERITPDDPRYGDLKAIAVDLNVPDDPAADAAPGAELEARYRARDHAA
ncbi:hypothetical protein [Actinomadura opuntiae]|uniref:hypothetical protein n=1 Tax=Actinomadura sp. OS1-43 TaxID=604315 RepID=UPI00255A94DB|nr:hypothetical protein [Actinomadura sp. OS1-43]MDL4813113.1 hypothetical protein [Actinomadura sp. OS1-43]